MKKTWQIFFIACLLFGFSTLAIATDGLPAAASTLPWWAWTLLLFGTTFAIGVVAVLGGVGGGLFFVPIISGFFPLPP